MSEIDWSKAPEGATHYQKECVEFYASWIKRVEDSDKLLGIIDDGIDSAWGAAGWYSDKKDILIPRPSSLAWNGEGLPPVGAFIVNAGDCKGKSEVILHRHGMALVEQEDGVAADYVLFGKSECRLAPTPEQIAAEDRERAVQEMHDLVGDIEQVPTWTDALRKLYDSGYRKVEP